MEENKKIIKSFSRTEFVTVNVVSDWVNSIRDLLGMEQKTYAKIVNEKMEEIFADIELEGNIIWFRQEIDRTFGTAIQITIYGQLEVN